MNSRIKLIGLTNVSVLALFVFSIVPAQAQVLERKAIDRLDNRAEFRLDLLGFLQTRRRSWPRPVGFALMPAASTGFNINNTISTMAAGPNVQVLGNGTHGRLTKWTGFNSNNSVIGNSTIFEDKDGLVGIGTDSPTSRLTVAGTIHSLSSGFKFPDGSVQTSAGLTSIPIPFILSAPVTFPGALMTLTNTGPGAVPIGGTGLQVTGQESSVNGGTGVETFGGQSNGTGGTGVRAFGGEGIGGFGGLGAELVGGDSDVSQAGAGANVQGGRSNILGGVGLFVGGGQSLSGIGGTGASFGGGVGGEGGIGLEVVGGKGFTGTGGIGMRLFGGDSTSGPGADGLVVTAGVGTPSGRAAVFNGDVEIAGNLNVTGATKNFKIDHPLDPENKYLYHAAIESAEALNVYSGNARLDPNGEAIVELPGWFEALNKDFRYQLTCMGGFAQVYIAEKIAGNRFKISGGVAGLEISWQVTGVRSDRAMLRHPFKAEQDKTERERGYYLHPELYDQPEEKSIQRLRDPRFAQRMKRMKQNGGRTGPNER